MNTTAVRRALYGKLAGDTTLTNMLGTPGAGFNKAIYFSVAPEDAQFPYVLFSKQAGTPTYALTRGTPAYQDDVWQVKGVDHPSSTDSDTAEAIQARLLALLTDTTLSISGEDLLYLRPYSDVQFAEAQSGEIYHHAGGLFRLTHATT